VRKPVKRRVIPGEVVDFFNSFLVGEVDKSEVGLVLISEFAEISLGDGFGDGSGVGD